MEFKETKQITFKQFCKDYREYYKCKDVFIRDESEVEIVMWDLYESENFEFDYENKAIELY